MVLTQHRPRSRQERRVHFADTEKADAPEDEDMRLIRAFISTEHDDVNPALADLVREHVHASMAVTPYIPQDHAEPGTIARRTRSQMPLEEVSLEELECIYMIRARTVTTSCYI